MPPKVKYVEAEEWVHLAPKGNALQQVGLWLYNSKKRTVLDRDRDRWAIVIVFYTCFYAALALMTALCMLAFEATIDEMRPRYILEQSSIGGTPGITSLPSGIVGLRGTVRHIPNVLQPHENLTWFQQKSGCKAADNYGYPDNPCVYIKMNRILSWTPRPYDEMPREAGEELTAHVAAQPADKRNMIWVSCWLDPIGTIGGVGLGTPQVTFPWGRGIPADAFPYMNQANYSNPLLAVQVSRASRSGEYYLRCRTWARNIVYNPRMARGVGFVRIHCRM